MEDFVWVLMAGLVLFLLAGALSFPFPQLIGSSGNRKNITLYSEVIGAVGKIEKSYRDINIGQAEVGTSRGETIIRQEVQATVSNGLLSKNFIREDFYVNSPETAKASFKVSETNLYGKLWVKVNGNEIFSAKAGQGTQPEIELEGLQTGKNEVEVGVTPSPAKFWGASVYRLDNFKLKVIDNRHQDFSHSFEINEYETTGFSSGKLSFRVTEALRKDALRITINGKNIYSKRPMKRPSPYTIDFYANNTGLSVGENQLTIKTREGSHYTLNNLGIRIFYYGNPEEKTVVREFEIDKEEYKRLSQDNYQGMISFDARIHLEGNLDLELPLRKFSLKPSAGKNRLYFDSEDIKQGSNQLKLRTSGRFNLQDLEIKIVPTDD